MSDLNCGGIGDPIALNSHEANEVLAEQQDEQFERDLESEIENSEKFLEGARLISEAYKEWEHYCLDNCYDPDKVTAMIQIKKEILDLTGDVV